MGTTSAFDHINGYFFVYDLVLVFFDCGLVVMISSAIVL